MKKLDDLPKVPHSYADVMKAMAVLHKLVLKQSAAYGGKNHKYLPAQVVEGSLLQSISAQTDEVFEGDEVERLLGVTHDKAEMLFKHLESQDDKKGIGMLVGLLKMLGASMGANNDGK